MIRASLLARAMLALIPLACLDASALGLGRGPGSAILGSRLDFQVPVRLDAGETLAPECISAEVRFGDSLVPPGLVSVSLVSSPGGDAIRVRTSSAIDEPLVSVSISAGCEVRLSRRFTLFADPIEFAASPRLANAEAMSPALPAGATPAPASAAGARATGGTDGSVPSAAAATAPAAAPVVPVAPAMATSAASAPASSVSSPDASRPSSAAPVARAADAAAAVPRSAAAGAKSEAPRKAAPRQRPAEAAEGGAGQSKSAAAAQSRLTIDSPGLPKTAAAIREQQQVALKAAQDAALAAEAAASAAQARAASMEKTLEALQRDAKANREAIARLTDALANAQTSSNDTTLWMALAAALGLVSGGLAFALRRERRSASSAWAGDPSGGVASDFDVKEAGPEAAPSGLGATASSAAAAAAAVPLSVAPADAGAAVLPTGEAPQSATAGVPAPLAEPEVFGPVSSAPMRNISIEELLDLEQQVEFFTVLGQDEPAVELLTEHVRKTGGTHPFPYLKLLEIYRRLGERDAYERTRTRFNQRFNAVAPAFDAPADEVVRPLEDYPRAIDRIQRSWSQPVDAMATLENMLVRAEGREGFGVAALEEVLFLFTLARDVHLQQAGPASESGGDVDVLLPFADSKPMGFVDSTVSDEVAAKESSSGSLAVNFEDEGDLSPAVPPMVSQSARFGITVGIPPEEADRAVAQEVARPVASVAPRTSLQPEVPDANAGAVDLPLGASLMGPLEGSSGGSLDSDDSSAVDLQLGESAMTPLDQGPADLTLKGRSELPMLSSRGSDEESMDLELGGSMMGSLFGELPKPSGSRSSSVLETAPESAPLPSLEIPLDFDAPAPAVPAPPAPLPSFEINLEGLELEPRPPKPAPGDDGAKGP